jgi:SAM-dependent methyltransferase
MGAAARFYRKLKMRHLGALADQVPEKYWSNFVCVGGATEQVFVVNRLLAGMGSHLSVLVVGVFGGRDFWGLKVLGHQVAGLDLEAIADCPGTIAGSAEGAWPFPSAAFDVVIMGEVLEHLICDAAALAEAHRVLRGTGHLVVTVPFLHDFPDHHIRVHTPATIRRLLSAAAFEVTDYLERPGLFPMANMNYVNHALAAAAFLLTGRSIYGWLLRQYGKAEWELGHIGWLPRRALWYLLGVNWGCTLLCLPKAGKLDYHEVNRQDFCRS